MDGWKRWSTTKSYLIGETLVIFFLPFFAILKDPGIMQYRHVALIVGLLYTIMLARMHRFTLTTMGVVKPTVAMLRNKQLIFGLIAGMGLWGLCQLFPRIIVGSPEDILPWIRQLPLPVILLFYCLYSVPVQEFLFRGFLTERLRLISANRNFLILYTGIVFALVHLPFVNKLFFIGTLPLGLYLGYIYTKDRNLWVPVIIHAFLGSILIGEIIYHIRAI